MFAKRRTYTSKILLAVAIIGVFYWIFSRPHTENLADYIPSDQTVIYAELPTQLHPSTVAFIKDKTGIDLNIPGLTESVNSITMIRLKEESNPVSHTFIALQPTNEETQKNITNYFNGAKITAGAISISESSKPLIFAAQNQQDFQYAVSLFSAEIIEKKAPALSEDNSFIKAREQHREYPYFIFAQPEVDQSFFVLPIQEKTTMIPLINTFPGTYEAHFDVHDDGIRGELISTKNPVIAENNEATQNSSVTQSYRALTLSLFPIDPDMFIGGTSLSNILNETTNLSLPLISKIVAQYLPGISYEKDLVPLMTGEFGFITARRQNYTAALLINQLDTVPAEAHVQLEKIVSSFAKGAAQLSFSTQPFILRDGTEALERVPEPNGVVIKTEKAGDDTIYSVIFGQYDEETPQGIFAAITHGKLFLSNERQLITQAISQVQEPGLNFRDGDLYRIGLQPLLKNPQLTGLMHLDFGKNAKGLYSFSKRKFSDYTETQFQFVIE